MAFKSMGLDPVTSKGIELLKVAARKRGLTFILTSGFRSFTEQAELIRSGRAITPAAPGRSTHNYGYAFDAVVPQGLNSPQQRALGQIGEALGLSWGGRFRDPVHFQVVTPQDWARALQIAGLG